ncbi:MAG: hypothetical protein MOGMAGMI_01692 [Candidatus Omnitrophica bacterium]|nr:hypothetical protein [Candidatus Omnitrophota bacterium]
MTNKGQLPLAELRSKAQVLAQSGALVRRDNALAVRDDLKKLPDRMRDGWEPATPVDLAALPDAELPFIVGLSTAPEDAFRESGAGIGMFQLREELREIGSGFDLIVDAARGEVTAVISGIRTSARPAGARLALATSHRYAQHVELAGRLVIPEHIQGDQRRAYAQRHLQAHGFSSQEADAIYDRFGGDFSDRPVDPFDPARRAPRITPATAWQDLQAATGYNKATVIRDVLGSGLLGDEGEARAAFERAVRDYSAGGVVEGKRGAQLWDHVQQRLVALAEFEAMQRIASGDLEVVQDLPYTRSSNMLRRIAGLIEQGQPGVADVLREAVVRRAGERVNFKTFVQNVISDTIVDPAFDRVLTSTFGDAVPQHAADKIREGVLGQIYQHVARDPSLIDEYFRTGNIVYNTHSLVPEVEPVDLQEYALTKLLQLTSTLSGGHALKQAVTIAPFVLFVAREIKPLLNGPGGAAAAVARLDLIRNIFVPTMNHEIGKTRYKAVTERKPWLPTEKKLIELFTDLELFDLFQVANRKKLTLEQLLPGQDLSALAAAGSSGDAARVESVAGVLRGRTDELFREDYPKAAKADDRMRGKGSAGLGLYELYVRRILGSLTDLMDFWGLRGTSPLNRLLFGVTAAALTGVGIFVAINGSLALGAMILGAVPLILPVIFGKAASERGRWFFLPVMTAANVYMMGLLTHHLYWKLILINPLSLGFLSTTALMLLMFVPTIMSVYHITKALYSLVLLNDRFWSDTARSLTGWRSFFRFGGHWPATFGKWYREIQSAEEASGPLLSTGENFGEYLSRLVEDLRVDKQLLSDQEAASWQAALQGRGEFVQPASKKAFDILKMAFHAVSQRKPELDPYELLQPTSSHVMGAGELITHTFANSATLGTFSADPDNPDRQTSLLGYTARTHPAEWANAIERLREQGIPEPFLTALSRVNEWTDIKALVYDGVSPGAALTPLSPAQRQVVIEGVERWLNEIRPNDSSVIHSLAQDHLEYHLRFSYEVGDLGYHRAVKAVTADGSTVQEAYERLQTTVATVPDALVERWLSRDETLTSQEAAAAAGRVFAEGYEVYAAMTGPKLRQIYKSVPLYLNFAGQSGGSNITGTPAAELSGKLAALTPAVLVTPELTDARTRLVEGLREFDPAAAADKSIFATIDQWAAEYTAWRRAADTDIVNVLAAATPVQRADLLASLDKLDQSAAVVVRANASGVNYAFHNRGDELLPIKNSAIGADLWQSYQRQDNFDAHVRAYPGQNVWRVNWATLQSETRNPQIIAVNMMMKIWASSTDAFPVTRLYSIAQEVWTGEVQRGTPEQLTFYGKGGVALYVVALLTPPGEDSSAVLLLQRYQERVAGVQIEYYGKEWGRPVADVTATEMRYGMNVTRFMMDRGQFAVMSNPKLGFDVKLSHLFLWAHYFSAVFAIALIVALPILSPFSALAFLKPFAFFVGSSFLLLEAINVNNFVRHWRDTGSFWQGAGRALADIWFAMPFYVFMIPFFFRGVWLASLERFEFIRTEKEALLAKLTPDQRFEQQLLFKLFGEKGFPLNGIIGMAGVTAYLIAVLMMTPYGPIILIPYLMAAVSIVSGDYVTGVYKDRKGNLVGYRWSAPYRGLLRRFVLIARSTWTWLRSPRQTPPAPAPAQQQPGQQPVQPPARPAGARLAAWSGVADGQIRGWAQDFSRQIELRGQDGAAFPNIETAVAAPTGEEAETALYIDLGGTNLRVGSAVLNGDRTLDVDPEPLKQPIPGEHITGGGDSLIRYVAAQVKSYMESKGLSKAREYKLGFTFSFPLVKSDIRTGIVAPDAQGVKGFDFSQLIARGSGPEREDLVAILEKELADIGVDNVRITALVNDTESTRDLGQYLDPRTIAGVIVGTGHNIAIRKYGRSINLETARFAGFERDEDDVRLDELSANPGKQLFEKALSGKYLGPLAGIKIDRLVSEGVLFGGQSSARIQDHQYESPDYQGVSSTFLSTLLALDLSTAQGEAEAITEVGRYMQVANVGRADVEVLVALAKDIVTRSAHLVGGVALAGVLLDQERTAAPTGEYAFALDGSLLRIPGYLEAVRDGLKRIFPADYIDSRITLFEAPDGSGAGAAVTAVIAGRTGARLAAGAPIDVIAAPIEVAVVAADPGTADRRIEAVRELLGPGLSAQFEFRALDRSQVDDYISVAIPGAYRVLVGDDAFGAQASWPSDPAAVLERLVDISVDRQRRRQAELDRGEALLGFVAALLEDPSVITPAGAVTAGLEGRIEDLRRILRELELPAVGPIEAVRAGSGVRLFASGRFVAESALDEARLAVLLERAFASRSDAERVAAVREALSALLAASGDTGSQDFIANATAAVGAALRAYASIVRGQTVIEPAEVREGSKTIAVMDETFRRDTARYLEEAAYIRGLDPGMRFTIVVPMTDAYRGLSYGEQVSLYLGGQPVTGPFDLLFVEGADTLAAVQGAIEGPFVLAGGESLQVGDVDPDREALLMQVDARAETHRGVMVVAAKVLYAGRDAVVPGLSVLGERVLRYLPAVRPLELLKLLREANTALRAVGAAA